MQEGEGVDGTYSKSIDHCGLRHTMSRHTLHNVWIQFLMDEKLLPALDIVVIDDGSTDATARIVRKYINRFPESFRLVSQENGGYGAAVNHALALAQGEYFKTVDGDDWVDTKELLTVVC